MRVCYATCVPLNERAAGPAARSSPCPHIPTCMRLRALVSPAPLGEHRAARSTPCSTSRCPPPPPPPQARPPTRRPHAQQQHARRTSWNMSAASSSSNPAGQRGGGAPWAAHASPGRPTSRPCTAKASAHPQPRLVGTIHPKGPAAQTQARRAAQCAAPGPSLDF